MSTLFVFFEITLFVKTATTVVLSTCIRVGCCGHAISIRIWCNLMHLSAVVNKEANSASADDGITNLIIRGIVSTAPLKEVIVTF